MSKNEVLDDVICYIEENICSKLTVEDIAAKAYISPAHLQRLFHVTFDMTIAEYVRGRKLHDVGFEHESSFIRSFKREFGLTPHEARKQPYGIKITPPG